MALQANLRKYIRQRNELNYVKQHAATHVNEIKLNHGLIVILRNGPVVNMQIK
jgi:hypothetical protein